MLERTRWILTCRNGLVVGTGSIPYIPHQLTGASDKPNQAETHQDLEQSDDITVVRPRLILCRGAERHSSMSLFLNGLQSLFAGTTVLEMISAFL